MAAGDYNFIRTRSQIIEDALRKVGGLSEGHVMSAYQEANGVSALNTLVNSWQTKGAFLWTEVLQSTSITANDYDYSIPAAPTTAAPYISIDKAFIRDGNQDFNLEIKSWRDYQDIFRKDITGQPSVLAVDYANRTMYLWCVPEKAYSLYTYGIVKLKDFDSDTAQGDIPSRWQRALMFGLAYDLSFEYPMAQGERTALKIEAAEAFMDGKNTESMSSSDNNSVASCYPSR